MRFLIAILFLRLAICLTVGSCFAQDTSLPRSTSETQGVSSVQILEFIETANLEVDSMPAFRDKPFPENRDGQTKLSETIAKLKSNR